MCLSAQQMLLSMQQMLWASGLSLQFIFHLQRYCLHFCIACTCLTHKLGGQSWKIPLPALSCSNTLPKEAIHRMLSQIISIIRLLAFLFTSLAFVMASVLACCYSVIMLCVLAVSSLVLCVKPHQFKSSESLVFELGWGREVCGLIKVL